MTEQYPGQRPPTDGGPWTSAPPAQAGYGPAYPQGPQYTQGPPAPADYRPYSQGPPVKPSRGPLSTKKLVGRIRGSVAAVVVVMVLAFGVVYAVGPKPD